MTKNEFVLELSKYYSADIVDNIMLGCKNKKVSSIRINRLKTTRTEVISFFKDNKIDFEEITWYEDAFIVIDDNEIKSSSLYKDGKIYSQSLSSMLPPLFMDLKDGSSVLDMTAAPGSKTTQIASLTKDKVMITAIEKNKIRAERLQFNLNKQGVKKVNVLNIDARNLDAYFMFDEILLDAPCSGSGTNELNDFSSLSSDLINRSIKFQKQLLDIASNHVVIGGCILYSTCSILPCENEEQIKDFLRRHANFVLEKIDVSYYVTLPILDSRLEGTLLICPTDRFEGFFVAKLKRIS